MSKTISEKRGPKTPEGKQRISLNALKHGLHARSPQARQALEAEQTLSYDEALDIAKESYQPADRIEDMLVGRIATCMCRLTRLEAMERRMFQRHSLRFVPGSDFEALLRAERMVSQEMHRCIRSLAAKRSGDHKANQQKPVLSVGPSGEHYCQTNEPILTRHLGGVPTRHLERSERSAFHTITHPDKADSSSSLFGMTTPGTVHGRIQALDSDRSKTRETISSHEETEREIVPHQTHDTS